MYSSPQLTIDKKFRGSISDPQVFDAPIDVDDPQLVIDYYTKRMKEIEDYISKRLWYFDDPYGFTSEQWELFIRNLKSLLDTAVLKGNIHIQLPEGPVRSLADAAVKAARARIEDMIDEAEFSKELVASEERTQVLAKQIQASQSQQSSTWFWTVSATILLGAGVLYYRRRQRSRNA